MKNDLFLKDVFNVLSKKLIRITQSSYSADKDSNSELNETLTQIAEIVYAAKHYINFYEKYSD